MMQCDHSHESSFAWWQLLFQKGVDLTAHKGGVSVIQNTSNSTDKIKKNSLLVFTTFILMFEAQKSENILWRFDVWFKNPDLLRATDRH